MRHGDGGRQLRHSAIARADIELTATAFSESAITE